MSRRALRITGARPNQAGPFWLRKKLPVRSGFDTFEFQLTHQAPLFFHGADGFAFVLQNSGPEALGGVGPAGGFGVSDPMYPEDEGIPWAVAVFFDTFRNSNENDVPRTALRSVQMVDRLKHAGLRRVSRSRRTSAFA